MKNLIIALLILCTQVGCTQSRYNQGAATTKNYYEELPYDDLNGKFFVTVEVNGKPRRFLFDTGAICMVSDQLADEMNLTNIHTDDVVDVNGTHFKMHDVKLDIKCGSTLFAGTPALRGLQGEVFKCWSVDGIIGSNMLRNSLVRFNSAKHTIIITDQKDKLQLNSKNSGKLNIHTDGQSTPILTIPFGKNATMAMEFDSGDNKMLRLTDGLVNQITKGSVYRVVGLGYGANNMGAMGLQKDAPKRRLYIPSFNLGSTQFNNSVTDTNDSGIPGIGTELLKYGTLTLDYINQKYYFDPITPTVNLDARGWPVALTVKNNQLIIGATWDALKDMAKPGEQVIAVDEKDYSHIDLCDLVNKKPVLDGKQTAVLTIKNADGSTRQLTIENKDYSTASTVASH
ncbi:aspartyl protease [Mucilaginibacter yixingensis]|uniref:Aspartyl protease n=1 Tax=Mucilaginibacter yixingensis TaxID=1295612 RepID=A0A2T5J9W0_9SPHI|nr:retropepsin-like aspartic protease [Mucilaginibacter yixingensis]PTQ96856.1 aspartyl protease [Mucilaginibacter yixingensis]